MAAQAVLYIHGQGGSAAESAHYQPLFPDGEVLGLDYRGSVPWEVGPEIGDAVTALRDRCESIVLIANSIGAFFSMYAGVDRLIRRAYFISPIVDMEGLIGGMMRLAHVDEAVLQARGVIPTAYGELSWDYLSYVRSHPLNWTAPTHILCGSRDTLSPPETVRTFAERRRASLTVMEGGEHWFHTPEQMRFLDDWLREKELQA